MARMTWGFVPRFLPGHSIYNGVDLTGGVAFIFTPTNSRNHVEPVEITRPDDGPLMLLQGRSPAFRWRLSCRKISQWHARDRGRTIRQGVRNLYLASTWRLRKLARLNEFQNSCGCRPGVCRGPCPSRLEWHPRCRTSNHKKGDGIQKTLIPQDGRDCYFIST